MSSDDASRTSSSNDENDDDLQLAADDSSNDLPNAGIAAGSNDDGSNKGGVSDVAVSASHADGTIFQADSQYGMKYVGETTGDVYGVQTEAEEAAEIAKESEKPSIPPFDAGPVAPPSNPADVYGLATPVPTTPALIPTPRLNAELSKKENDDKNKKIKKNVIRDVEREREIERDRETTSLEEIYERKRRERLEQGDELYSGAERSELPARPFWDRVFKPFLSFSFLVRISLISAAAFIPLFLATLFFAKILSGDVAKLIAEHQEMNVLFAFFSCVWRDKMIFMLFCFLWGVFSIPHSFHIFVETAAGADEIDDWPEYNFIGGLGQFLWLAILITIAGIPGAALFSALRLNSVVGFTLSGTAITPIFFLSCMQTDSLFTLVTKEILVSLKRLVKSWLNFVFIAFAFLFGTVGLALAAIGFVVRSDGSPWNAAIAAAGVSLAFSFIPALYLRFLGRLAWIIDDDARKRVADDDDEAGADDETDSQN